MTRRAPLDVARDLMREKYPDALLAFVAGSFNRGEATAFSDIDLVVVFQKLDHAWRESFTFEGWPIEAFAHDVQTLRFFFFEFDAKRGIPSLAAMVAEGPTVPIDHPLANELKRLARNVINARPPQWDQNTLVTKRYAITDLIDDLRDPRTPLEAAAIIGVLHEQLGDFYFRAQGVWSAPRKHLPRRLAKLNPPLFVRWQEAFLEAWRGQTKKLIDLTEEILHPYGGLFFDGYRLDAPSDWKLAANPPS